MGIFLAAALAVTICKLPCMPQPTAHPPTCPEGQTIVYEATGTCPASKKDECPMAFVGTKSRKRATKATCKEVVCQFHCRK